MEKWRQRLRSLNPRIDLRETFYPEQLEPRHPTLLSSGSLLATSLVAARLLHIIALRGGTRMKHTWTHRICNMLEDALLPEAIIHCDNEVDRILEWLEGRAQTQQTDADEPEQFIPSNTPELDIMFAAELENRISVAQFALAENYDLQLEYYDEPSSSWPRIRVTPRDIIHPIASETPEHPEQPSQDTSPQLRVTNTDGQSLTISFKAIRWLMPVTRHKTDPPQSTKPHNPPPKKDPPSGRLLSFPGSPRSDQ